jgi:hypothetical protein
VAISVGIGGVVGCASVVVIGDDLFVSCSVVAAVPVKVCTGILVVSVVNGVVAGGA